MIGPVHTVNCCLFACIILEYILLYSKDTNSKELTVSDSHVLASF